MTDILKSSLVAMTATLFCMYLLRPLAYRIGLVDRPGGRKQHESDVPLIGGIAVFFGFCFALLTLPLSLQFYRGLLAGGSLLMLIGVLDDFQELGSKVRILGQTLAVLFLIIWGQHSVTQLGDLFFLGNIALGAWGFPLTVLVVLGYINSMNMIDGQDGLSGGVALGQVLWLGLLSYKVNRHNDMTILFILGILLFVFLAFNMRFPWRARATVFMGDAGITFVAFIIAWFGVDLSQVDLAVIKPLTVLWILSFPVFDLINVMVHRIQRGLSPLQAGRDHIHHVLHLNGVDAGLSTLLLVSVSFTFGFLGLLFNHMGLCDGWQFVAWLAALAAYLMFVRILRVPRHEMNAC